MKFSSIFLFFFIFSCSNSYKNITTSEEDKNYYDLIEAKLFDSNGSEIRISLPNDWSEIDSDLLDDNVIAQYELFNKDFGYKLTVTKLESTNTIKLNDKQYLKIAGDQYEKNYDILVKSFPKAIFKDFQLINFESNLIIGGNYFGKRISSYIDNRLKGTDLEDVNVTECQFITLQNNRKYSFSLSYFGNNKGLSENVAFFSAIGGTINFK